MLVRIRKSARDNRSRNYSSWEKNVGSDFQN